MTTFNILDDQNNQIGCIVGLTISTLKLSSNVEDITCISDIYSNSIDDFDQVIFKYKGILFETFNFDIPTFTIQFSKKYALFKYFVTFSCDNGIGTIEQEGFFSYNDPIELVTCQYSSQSVILDLSTDFINDFTTLQMYSIAGYIQAYDLANQRLAFTLIESTPVATLAYGYYLITTPGQVTVKAQIDSIITFAEPITVSERTVIPIFKHIHLNVKEFQGILSTDEQSGVASVATFENNGFSAFLASETLSGDVYLVIKTLNHNAFNIKLQIDGTDYTYQLDSTQYVQNISARAIKFSFIHQIVGSEPVPSVKCASQSIDLYAGAGPGWFVEYHTDYSVNILIVFDYFQCQDDVFDVSLQFNDLIYYSELTQFLQMTSFTSTPVDVGTRFIYLTGIYHKTNLVQEPIFQYSGTLDSSKCTSVDYSLNQCLLKLESTSPTQTLLISKASFHDIVIESDQTTNILVNYALGLNFATTFFNIIPVGSAATCDVNVKLLIFDGTTQVEEMTCQNNKYQITNNGFTQLSEVRFEFLTLIDGTPYQWQWSNPISIAPPADPTQDWEFFINLDRAFIFIKLQNAPTAGNEVKASYVEGSGTFSDSMDAVLFDELNHVLVNYTGDFLFRLEEDITKNNFEYYLKDDVWFSTIVADVVEGQKFQFKISSSGQNPVTVPFNHKQLMRVTLCNSLPEINCVESGTFDQFDQIIVSKSNLTPLHNKVTVYYQYNNTHQNIINTYQLTFDASDKTQNIVQELFVDRVVRITQENIDKGFLLTNSKCMNDGTLVINVVQPELYCSTNQLFEFIVQSQDDSNYEFLRQIRLEDEFFVEYQFFFTEISFQVVSEGNNVNCKQNTYVKVLSLSSKINCNSDTNKYQSKKISLKQSNGPIQLGLFYNGNALIPDYQFYEDTQTLDAQQQINMVVQKFIALTVDNNEALTMADTQIPVGANCISDVMGKSLEFTRGIIVTYDNCPQTRIDVFNGVYFSQFYGDDSFDWFNVKTIVMKLRQNQVIFEMVVGQKVIKPQEVTVVQLSHCNVVLLQDYCSTSSNKLIPQINENFIISNAMNQFGITQDVFLEYKMTQYLKSTIGAQQFDVDATSTFPVRVQIILQRVVQIHSNALIQNIDVAQDTVLKCQNINQSSYQQMSNMAKYNIFLCPIAYLATLIKISSLNTIDMEYILTNDFYQTLQFTEYSVTYPYQYDSSINLVPTLNCNEGVVEMQYISRTTDINSYPTEIYSKIHKNRNCQTINIFYNNLAHSLENINVFTRQFAVDVEKIKCNKRLLIVESNDNVNVNPINESNLMDQCFLQNQVNSVVYSLISGQKMLCLITNSIITVQKSNVIEIQYSTKYYSSQIFTQYLNIHFQQKGLDSYAVIDGEGDYVIQNKLGLRFYCQSIQNQIYLKASTKTMYFSFNDSCLLPSLQVILKQQQVYIQNFTIDIDAQPIIITNKVIKVDQFFSPLQNIVLDPTENTYSVSYSGSMLVDQCSSIYSYNKLNRQCYIICSTPLLDNEEHLQFNIPRYFVKDIVITRTSLYQVISQMDFYSAYINITFNSQLRNCNNDIIITVVEMGTLIDTLTCLNGNSYQMQSQLLNYGVSYQIILKYGLSIITQLNDQFTNVGDYFLSINLLQQYCLVKKPENVNIILASGIVFTLDAINPSHIFSISGTSTVTYTDQNTMQSSIRQYSYYTWFVNYGEIVFDGNSLNFKASQSIAICQRKVKISNTPQYGSDQCLINQCDGLSIDFIILNIVEVCHSADIQEISRSSCNDFQFVDIPANNFVQYFSATFDTPPLCISDKCETFGMTIYMKYPVPFYRCNSQIQHFQPFQNKIYSIQTGLPSNIMLQLNDENLLTFVDICNFRKLPFKYVDTTQNFVYCSNQYCKNFRSLDTTSIQKELYLKNSECVESCGGDMLLYESENERVCSTTCPSGYYILFLVDKVEFTCNKTRGIDCVYYIYQQTPQNFRCITVDQCQFTYSTSISDVFCTTGCQVYDFIILPQIPFTPKICTPKCSNSYNHERECVDCSLDNYFYVKETKKCTDATPCATKLQIAGKNICNDCQNLVKLAVTQTYSSVISMICVTGCAQNLNTDLKTCFNGSCEQLFGVDLPQQKTKLKDKICEASCNPQFELTQYVCDKCLKPDRYQLSTTTCTTTMTDCNKIWNYSTTYVCGDNVPCRTQQGLWFQNNQQQRPICNLDCPLSQNIINDIDDNNQYVCSIFIEQKYLIFVEQTLLQKYYQFHENCDPNQNRIIIQPSGIYCTLQSNCILKLIEVNDKFAYCANCSSQQVIKFSNNNNEFQFQCVHQSHIDCVIMVYQKICVKSVDYSCNDLVTQTNFIQSNLVYQNGRNCQQSCNMYYKYEFDANIQQSTNMFSCIDSCEGLFIVVKNQQCIEFQSEQTFEIYASIIECETYQILSANKFECQESCQMFYFIKNDNTICTSNCFKHNLFAQGQLCTECTELNKFKDINSKQCVNQCPILANQLTHTCDSYCGLTIYKINFWYCNSCPLYQNVADFSCLTECNELYIINIANICSELNCTQQKYTLYQNWFQDPINKYCSLECNSQYDFVTLDNVCTLCEDENYFVRYDQSYIQYPLCSTSCQKYKSITLNVKYCINTCNYATQILSEIENTCYLLNDGCPNPYIGFLELQNQLLCTETCAFYIEINEIKKCFSKCPLQQNVIQLENLIIGKCIATENCNFDVFIYKENTYCNNNCQAINSYQADFLVCDEQCSYQYTNIINICELLDLTCQNSSFIQINPINNSFNCVNLCSNFVKIQNNEPQCSDCNTNIDIQAYFGSNTLNGTCLSIENYEDCKLFGKNYYQFVNPHYMCVTSCDKIYNSMCVDKCSDYNKYYLDGICISDSECGQLLLIQQADQYCVLNCEEDQSINIINKICENSCSIQVKIIQTEQLCVDQADFTNYLMISQRTYNYIDDCEFYIFNISLTQQLCLDISCSKFETLNQWRLNFSLNENLKYCTDFCPTNQFYQIMIKGEKQCTNCSISNFYRHALKFDSNSELAVPLCNNSVSGNNSNGTWCNFIHIVVENSKNVIQCETDCIDTFKYYGYQLIRPLNIKNNFCLNECQDKYADNGVCVSSCQFIYYEIQFNNKTCNTSCDHILSVGNKLQCILHCDNSKKIQMTNQYCNQCLPNQYLLINEIDMQFSCELLTNECNLNQIYDDQIKLCFNSTDLNQINNCNQMSVLSPLFVDYVFYKQIINQQYVCTSTCDADYVVINNNTCQDQCQADSETIALKFQTSLLYLYRKCLFSSESISLLVPQSECIKYIQITDAVFQCVNSDCIYDNVHYFKVDERECSSVCSNLYVNATWQCVNSCPNQHQYLQELQFCVEMCQFYVLNNGNQTCQASCALELIIYSYYCNGCENSILYFEQQLCDENYHSEDCQYLRNDTINNISICSQFNCAMQISQHFSQFNKLVNNECVQNCTEYNMYQLSQVCVECNQNQFRYVYNHDLMCSNTQPGVQFCNVYVTEVDYFQCSSLCADLQKLIIPTMECIFEKCTAPYILQSDLISCDDSCNLQYILIEEDERICKDSCTYIGQISSPNTECLNTSFNCQNRQFTFGQNTFCPYMCSNQVKFGGLQEYQCFFDGCYNYLVVFDDIQYCTVIPCIQNNIAFINNYATTQTFQTNNINYIKCSESCLTQYVNLDICTDCNSLHKYRKNLSLSSNCTDVKPPDCQSYQNFSIYYQCVDDCYPQLNQLDQCVDFCQNSYYQQDFICVIECQNYFVNQQCIDDSQSYIQSTTNQKMLYDSCSTIISIDSVNFCNDCTKQLQILDTNIFKCKSDCSGLVFLEFCLIDINCSEFNQIYAINLIYQQENMCLNTSCIHYSNNLCTLCNKIDEFVYLNHTCSSIPCLQYNYSEVGPYFCVSTCNNYYLQINEYIICTNQCDSLDDNKKCVDSCENFIYNFSCSNIIETSQFLDVKDNQTIIDYCQQSKWFRDNQGIQYCFQYCQMLFVVSQNSFQCTKNCIGLQLNSLCLVHPYEECNSSLVSSNPLLSQYKYKLGNLCVLQCSEFYMDENICSDCVNKYINETSMSCVDKCTKYYNYNRICTQNCEFYIDQDNMCVENCRNLYIQNQNCVSQCYPMYIYNNYKCQNEIQSNYIVIDNNIIRKLWSNCPNSYNIFVFNYSYCYNCENLIFTFIQNEASCKVIEQNVQNYENKVQTDLPCFKSPTYFTGLFATMIFDDEANCRTKCQIAYYLIGDQKHCTNCENGYISLSFVCQQQKQDCPYYWDLNQCVQFCPVYNNGTQCVTSCKILENKSCTNDCSLIKPFVLNGVCTKYISKMFILIQSGQNQLNSSCYETFFVMWNQLWCFDCNTGQIALQLQNSFICSTQNTVCDYKYFDSQICIDILCSQAGTIIPKFNNYIYYLTDEYNLQKQCVSSCPSYYIVGNEKQCANCQIFQFQQISGECTQEKGLFCSFYKLIERINICQQYCEKFVQNQYQCVDACQYFVNQLNECVSYCLYFEIIDQVKYCSNYDVSKVVSVIAQNQLITISQCNIQDIIILQTIKYCLNCFDSYGQITQFGIQCVEECNFNIVGKLCSAQSCQISQNYFPGFENQFKYMNLYSGSNGICQSSCPYFIVVSELEIYCTDCNSLDFPITMLKQYRNGNSCEKEKSCNFVVKIKESIYQCYDKCENRYLDEICLEICPQNHYNQNNKCVISCNTLIYQISIINERVCIDQCQDFKLQVQNMFLCQQNCSNMMIDIINKICVEITQSNDVIISYNQSLFILTCARYRKYNLVSQNSAECIDRNINCDYLIINENVCLNEPICDSIRIIFNNTQLQSQIYKNENNCIKECPQQFYQNNTCVVCTFYIKNNICYEQKPESCKYVYLQDNMAKLCTESCNNFKQNLVQVINEVQHCVAVCSYPYNFINQQNCVISCEFYINYSTNNTCVQQCVYQHYISGECTANQLSYVTINNSQIASQCNKYLQITNNEFKCVDFCNLTIHNFVCSSYSCSESSNLFQGQKTALWFNLVQNYCSPCEQFIDLSLLICVSECKSFFDSDRQCTNCMTGFRFLNKFCSDSYSSNLCPYYQTMNTFKVCYNQCESLVENHQCVSQCTLMFIDANQCSDVCKSKIYTIENNSNVCTSSCDLYLPNQLMGQSKCTSDCFFIKPVEKTCIDWCQFSQLNCFQQKTLQKCHLFITSQSCSPQCDQQLHNQVCHGDLKCEVHQILVQQSCVPFTNQLFIKDPNNQKVIVNFCNGINMNKQCYQVACTDDKVWIFNGCYDQNKCSKHKNGICTPIIKTDNEDWEQM